MRGEVWAAVHALAENEGITFDACLGLTPQVLNLLPQIPIDISFQTQIPLTITYCLESSIYRDGARSRVVFHPSARKSERPTLCPKSWVGLPTNQVRVWIVPHLRPLLTTPQDQVGRGAPDINLTAMHEVSLLPTAGDQVLWAQQQVIILFIPILLKMARCRAASPNPPTMREMVLGKMTTPKKTRAGSKPLVMGRWHQMAKKGRSTLTPKTPSPTLARSLVDMRTQTQSQTPERKSSPSGKSGTQKAQGQPP